LRIVRRPLLRVRSAAFMRVRLCAAAASSGEKAHSVRRTLVVRLDLPDKRPYSGHAFGCCGIFNLEQQGRFGEEPGMLRFLSIAGLAAALLGGADARAHHSFAAFFDGAQTTKLTGKVIMFRFTNPHGTKKQWAAETNSPAVLMRRGWTRQSIKPGEIITVDGWPARDGKPYLRLRQALDANGKPVGSSPFGQLDEK
jgi:hypothetical protein